VLALVSAAAVQVAALPPCDGGLLMRLDGEDGAFNGMSHSGALLVIRNLGPAPCRLPGLPRLKVQDAGGRDLPIVRQAPPGMHPGPMVLPVGVAPDAEVTAPLRWVSGPVYDRSRCLTPDRIVVSLGARLMTAPWPGGPICGRAGAPVTFEQPVLRPDPTL
jgi:hypothetical protein